MNSSMAQKLATTPALAPPPGVVPDFVHPASINQEVLIISAICLALMMLFVTVRVCSKMRHTSTFGWDDYASIFAMFGSIGYTSVFIATLRQYPRVVGPHQWDIPIIAITSSYAQRVEILAIFYNPLCLAAKLSLYLLYLRIFNPSVRTTYLVYIGITFTAVFHTASLLNNVISCTPRGGHTFLEAVANPKCTVSAITVGIVRAAINALIDFFMLYIPMPVVWTLQLPMRRKIGVCAIFMTGLLACTAGILSLYYRVQYKRTGDRFYNQALMLLMAVVEINIGIMCGCMPAFASFCRQFLPKLWGLPSLGHLGTRIKSWISRQSLLSKKKSSRTLSSSEYVEYNLRDDIHITLGSVTGGGKVPAVGRSSLVGMATQQYQPAAGPRSTDQLGGVGWA
ncbi:MAG: hypothetical protein FRX48_01528 [Lasallia pustulata]|uniref:Rhodopsin domain-containing protein n=1 Tax=Lasallia pustulata TaxID=136370 RepID=A0A5M8Q0S6_9LECA|nr:MAG: hypothetical protein FRX48_01528 [Lasallia pustulata]